MSAAQTKNGVCGKRDWVTPKGIDDTQRLTSARGKSKAPKVCEELGPRWAAMCKAHGETRFVWAHDGVHGNGWIELKENGVLLTSWCDGTWRVTEDPDVVDMSFGSSRHLCRYREGGFIVEDKIFIRSGTKGAVKTVGWIAGPCVKMVNAASLVQALKHRDLKKPLSAHHRWLKENLNSIRAKVGERGMDILKEGAAMWKRLPEDERKFYKDQAMEPKKMYAAYLAACKGAAAIVSYQAATKKCARSCKHKEQKQGKKVKKPLRRGAMKVQRFTQKIKEKGKKISSLVPQDKEPTRPLEGRQLHGMEVSNKSSDVPRILQQKGIENCGASGQEETSMPNKIGTSVGRRGTTVVMRNFPTKWLEPSNVSHLQTKVETLLSKFGVLLCKPELRRATSSGIVHARATFRESDMARKAVSGLSGIDPRSEGEKERAGFTAPHDDERFFIELEQPEERTQKVNEFRNEPLLQVATAACDSSGRLQRHFYLTLRDSFATPDGLERDRQSDPERPGMAAGEWADEYIGTSRGCIFPWCDERGTGWVAYHPAKRESAWFSLKTWKSWRMTFVMARLQQFVWCANAQNHIAEIRSSHAS